MASIPLLGGIITLALISLMLRFPRLRFAIDRPNERSLHDRPVPRTGGVAILAGIAVGAFATGWLPVAFLAALGLAVVSLIDDARGLPIAVRFAAHTLAAIALLAAYFADWSWPWLAIAVAAIVWTTNLFNFMDGSDGLAGGMAMIGFGAYGIAFAQAGHAAGAVVCATIALAAAAFLVFNFHPARVFMGDAGSVPLGFLAASLGLYGIDAAVWPVWFPVLVFSPFIVDATVTLARRALGGERFWEPHRSHYYQRLVRSGWGHRKTALAEYTLMLGCAVLAVGLREQPFGAQLAMLGAVALAYLALGRAVDATWARHR